MQIDQASLRQAALVGFTAAKRDGKSDDDAKQAGREAAAAHVEALAASGLAHLAPSETEQLLAYAAAIRAGSGAKDSSR